MSKGIKRVLLGALTLLTLGVSGCRQEPEKMPMEARMGPQEEHEARKAGLAVRFRDDFSQKYDPLEPLGMTRWTQLESGRSRTEDGFWLMDVWRDPPPGPGAVALGGLATTERTLHPELAGTNAVEITLAEFIHEKDYPIEMEAPDQLVHAWSLTVASWQGLVGGQSDDQRGVQLHLDLLRDDGLFVYLVRGILPEDFEKYPMDGFGLRDSQDGRDQNLSPSQLRKLHEKEIAHGGVFISVPTLILACRVYRTEEGIQDIIGRPRRWGLYLTDDANSVYWTLDDQVMDTRDISGYFGSSPGAIQDGAFLTVMGVASYQRNTWRMDDLEILGSP